VDGKWSITARRGDFSIESTPLRIPWINHDNTSARNKAARQSKITHMHLLDKKDLREMICNDEIFPVFDLTEKEKQVLIMHVVRGCTFRLIAYVMNLSHQRVFQVYTNALRKIKKQTLDILRQHHQSSRQKDLA
jgi:DNA-directed RNA polymerase specialized sigma subunit